MYPYIWPALGPEINCWVKEPTTRKQPNAIDDLGKLLLAQEFHLRGNSISRNEWQLSFLSGDHP
jgi:hypothetical protein